MNKKWLVGVSVVSVATVSCSDDPVQSSTGADTGFSTDRPYSDVDDGYYEDDGYYDDDDDVEDDGYYEDTYSFDDDDGYNDTYYEDDGYYEDTWYEDDGYYEDTWYSDDGYYGTTFGYEGPPDTTTDYGTTYTTHHDTGDTTSFDESTTGGDFGSTTSVETSFTTGTDGMFSSTDGGSSSDGGSTSDGGSSSTSDDGGSSGSTGGVTEIFEDPQPFGDDVTELDLIGDWNLPTDGSNPGYSMTLSVFPDGEFEWVEHDGDCIVVREATGALWVSGGSLVMLFDTFTGVAPWPVMDQFGFDSEAPFLIRFGYAPVLGHIALTGPPDLRVGAPWNSRGYRRTVGGATAVDVWVTEAELWDVQPGDTDASIIVRDRYTLDIGAGPDATLTHNRWWYDHGVQITDPPEISMLPFMDDGLANLTLDGAPFVYLSDAMASYAPGDNFQIGAPSACFAGGG